MYLHHASSGIVQTASRRGWGGEVGDVCCCHIISLPLGNKHCMVVAQSLRITDLNDNPSRWWDINNWRSESTSNKWQEDLPPSYCIITCLKRFSLHYYWPCVMYPLTSTSVFFQACRYQCSWSLLGSRCQAGWRWRKPMASWLLQPCRGLCRVRDLFSWFAACWSYLHIFGSGFQKTSFIYLLRRNVCS